jgi:hypothetical protein
VAATKTTFTGASVTAYLGARASASQRADCRVLMALLQRVTKQRPKMWGPSIVGYGVYRYTYETGHSGEAPEVGFAIRGRETVLYLDVSSDAQRSLLPKVGKHRMTKTCLYYKSLADLNQKVLERLVRGSIASIRRRYD